ncbi:Flp family type IVb pilin [Nocardioides sp.]|nr:Flp family type IVb pilin [Nocardioides sp.]HXH77978.1 Flp family type IVb pilin [Nocardioides sp.]
MSSQPEPRSERGASAVEYALLVGLIAAVLITVMTLLGGNIIPLYKLTF